MVIVNVVGINLGWMHGAGAAKDAVLAGGATYVKNVTARYGVVHDPASGILGDETADGQLYYGVPTKDEYIKTLPYERIEFYVREFIRFACQHPEHTFNVTPIGTGLAKVPVAVMKRFFANAIGLSNVNLPKIFGGSTDMKNINEPEPLFNSSAKVMTKIGIVGSSHAGENNVAALSEHLAKLNPETDTVVSGAGKGVDTMIARLAKAKGFKVIEFPPDKQSKEWLAGDYWAEFKKRNLQIAKESDRVVSFALPFKTTKCYHCANSGKDNNHEKTAGCFTGKANGNYEVIIMK